LIRWVSSQSRLVGFNYHPVWEIVFGLFLVMSAVAIPVLFFRFNGFQLKQYPEWLFCLGFFAFFSWMGRALIFQAFLARIEGDRVVIEHNLRDPPVSISRALGEWTNTLVSESSGEKGENLHLLVLVSGTEALELYRSVNPGEIAALRDAMVDLRRSAIPDTSSITKKG